MNKKIISAYTILLLIIIGSTYYANFCGCFSSIFSSNSTQTSFGVLAVNAQNPTNNSDLAQAVLQTEQEPSLSRFRENPILFNFDTNLSSSSINEATNARIDELVKYLRSNPTKQITIIGHTDNVGSANYNYELGLRRADFTKTQLLNRGVAASQLRTLSLGEALPIASGDDDNAHAQNRRTTILI